MYIIYIRAYIIYKSLLPGLFDSARSFFKTYGKPVAVKDRHILFYSFFLFYSLISFLL
nr:MAG TPA: hypothetical protein [Caudoviricetes sp.]